MIAAALTALTLMTPAQYIRPCPGGLPPPITPFNRAPPCYVAPPPGYYGYGGNPGQSALQAFEIANEAYQAWRQRPRGRPAAARAPSCLDLPQEAARECIRDQGIQFCERYPNDQACIEAEQKYGNSR